MICPECGTYLDNESTIVCPVCGTPINLSNKSEDTVESMREGRKNKTTTSKIENKSDKKTSAKDVEFNEYWDKSVLVETNIIHPKVAPIDFSPNEMKKRSVNWVLRGGIIIGILIVALIGTFLFFKRTSQGQLILARHFKAESPQAYWIVGDEFASQGDIVNAIRAYTIADTKDPNNADGLFSLASAYETGDFTNQAEAIYRRIIKDISPNRPEFYRALVRLLLSQNRDAEATNVLKLAYENTGLNTFLEQRRDMLPAPPEVSLPGGRYDTERTVTISSKEGYEIYYLMDDGTGRLPQDGKLYDGKPIKIPEGSVKLRAVCTSINLVSDPIEVKYILIYPSPAAPKANLAPGTYGKPKTLGLRIGDDNKDVVMHYTIDGTMPNENSPIYDGNPIKLPSGRVTIRAFSINTRGKTSSTMEVGYKIDTKPYLQKPYNYDDLFNGIKLNETNTETFFTQFGKPESQEEINYLSLINNNAKRYNYSWGYADFILVSNKWVLAKIDMKSKITESPRGIGFGSTEAEIVAAYKDMGQIANLDGTRGLYYNSPESGKILEDKDGRLVRYTCESANGYIWALEYRLNSAGAVNRIIHYYQP